MVDRDFFADTFDVAFAHKTPLFYFIGQSGHGDGKADTNGHSTVVADLDRLAFE